jgi:hypothetical protein
VSVVEFGCVDDGAEVPLSSSALMFFADENRATHLLFELVQF